MATKGFMGMYEIAIDDKGRVRIPNKYKAQLDDDFVVCYGNQACLSVYSSETWAEIMNAANGLSPLDSLADDFRRNICPTVADCKFDNAGRVLIPITHRDYAGLTKDVVAVGVGNHFELWDAETWKNGNFTSLEKRKEIQDKLSQKTGGRQVNGI